MGRLVFDEAGEATEAEVVAPPPARWSSNVEHSGATDDGADDDNAAWQGPGKRKRPRSRSLGRARKQKLGSLASQQPEADDGPPESTTVPDSTGTLPWPDCDAPRGKSLMKYYYRLQRIVPIQEWDSFEDGIHRPLPVTFRFSANADAAYRSVGEAILQRWERQGLGTRRLGVVDGWQLHIDKHALRSAYAETPEAALREWMIGGTTSGKLIRQEVASMLPAVVLGVAPGHTVLDMCAAPGSKTSQIVEMLDGNGMGGTGSKGGVVVANDNDAVRAYTLVKRIADLGPSKAAVLVTLHNAQQLPRPSERVASSSSSGSHGENGGGGGYDRIICDVPCTGDGTTRKHPEVFLRWEPLLGLRMHPLQLQIAMRACALLKVGGLLSYSTCSLNPIENEAVVAALLARCGGAIELVDVDRSAIASLCGGCAPGMDSWRVYDSKMRPHESLKELQAAANDGMPPAERRRFVATMWPPKPPPRSPHVSAPSTQSSAPAPVESDSSGEAKLNRHQRRMAAGIAAPVSADNTPWAPPPLERCVRLMANRSDCGGFFVALLRKLAPLPATPTPAWPHRAQKAAAAAGTPSGTDKPEGIDSYTYVAVPSELTAECAALVVASGVVASTKAATRLLRGRLFRRGAKGSCIVYLSEDCERICCGVRSGGTAAPRVNVVNAGATVFRRTRRASSTGGGRDAWSLTAVGRALLERLGKSA